MRSGLSTRRDADRPPQCNPKMLLPGRQIEARQVVREAFEVELLRERDIAHVAEQRDEVDTLGSKLDRIAERLLASFRIDARAGLVQQLLHVRVAGIVVEPATEE